MEYGPNLWLNVCVHGLEVNLRSRMMLCAVHAGNVYRETKHVVGSRALHRPVSIQSKYARLQYTVASKNGQLITVSQKRCQAFHDMT